MGARRRQGGGPMVVRAPMRRRDTPSWDESVSNQSQLAMLGKMDPELAELLDDTLHLHVKAAVRDILRNKKQNLSLLVAGGDAEQQEVVYSALANALGGGWRDGFLLYKEGDEHKGRGRVSQEIDGVTVTQMLVLEACDTCEQSPNPRASQRKGGSAGKEDEWAGSIALIQSSTLFCLADKDPTEDTSDLAVAEQASAIGKHVVYVAGSAANGVATEDLETANHLLHQHRHSATAAFLVSAREQESARAFVAFLHSVHEHDGADTALASVVLINENPGSLGAFVIASGDSLRESAVMRDLEATISAWAGLTMGHHGSDETTTLRVPESVDANPKLVTSSKLAVQFKEDPNNPEGKLPTQQNMLDLIKVRGGFLIDTKWAEAKSGEFDCDCDEVVVIAIAGDDDDEEEEEEAEDEEAVPTSTYVKRQHKGAIHDRHYTMACHHSSSMY